MRTRRTKRGLESRSSRFRSRASAFLPAQTSGDSTSPAPSIGSSRTTAGPAPACKTQFLQVSEAGEITNLGGLTQGIGLDVRPFLAGTLAASRRRAGDDVNAKAGLDLFYNITPSLKLTATFNTDFGETEVDARQINLSRFSLLFPEKRSFFLEGAGVFSFASTGPETPGGIPATGADVFPFFSRQIGLLAGTGSADRCGRSS